MVTACVLVSELLEHMETFYQEAVTFEQSGALADARTRLDYIRAIDIVLASTSGMSAPENGRHHKVQFAMFDMLHRIEQADT